MIVIKMELHSAITGRATPLGMMTICNRGDTENPRRGNYDVASYRKGTGLKSVVRRGSVENHARLAEPVWNLLAKALTSMGYK